MTRQTGLLILCAVLAVFFVGDRFLQQRQAIDPADRAERLLSGIIAARAGSGVAENSNTERRDDTEIGRTVLARPLFSSDRRPPRAAARPVVRTAAPEVRAPVNDNWELMATIVAEGRPPVALVRQRQSGASQRLAQGDSLGDWDVTSIEVSGVLFTAGDDESRLVLAGPERSGAATPRPGQPRPERRLDTSRPPPNGLTAPRTP